MDIRKKKPTATTHTTTKKKKGNQIHLKDILTTTISTNTKSHTYNRHAKQPIHSITEMY